MKVKKLILVSLCAALLMAGCDLFSPFNLDEALGEWEAATGTIKGVPATHIHLSVMSNGEMYDAGWDTADNSYWFFSDGSTIKNVFTGVYDGNDESTQIADNEAITITLKLKNGKLSATFSGSGPLDDVVFTDLMKASL